MKTDGLMVSVSGVRGRVGEALTPEVVATFAAGFGAWALAGAGGAARPRVVVGRDSRVSGPMFHRAVVAALQSVGCDIIDVGIAPTPTIQLAVESLHAAGGLAITASHNPIEWNALKFIAPTGLFLSAEEGAAMRAGDGPRQSRERPGTVSVRSSSTASAVARHIDRILESAVHRCRGHSARGACTSRWTVSAARAASSCRHCSNVSAAGSRPSISRPTADSHARRSRSPPIWERSRGWSGRAAPMSGFAVDPDVDRLALVDETGRAIGEDYTLALATAVVLRHRRGPVVTNLSTSRLIDDVAAEAGVPVIRTAVGRGQRRRSGCELSVRRSVGRGTAG